MSPPPNASWNRGFADAFVFYRGLWKPMDFKSRNGKARESQIEWWGSVDLDPVLVKTPEEALRIIGAVVTD